MSEHAMGRSDESLGSARLTRGALLVAIVVVALVGGMAGTPLATADAGVSADPGVNVTVNAADDVSAGDTGQATVVATGADNGVSAYEITLAVNDTDVATLEEVAVNADGDDGPLVSVERSADGSTVTVTAALLDATHEPAAEIELFDVTVAGHAEGTAALEVVAVEEISDLDITAYPVDQLSGTTLSVVDQPAPAATIELSTLEELETGTANTTTVTVTNATAGVSAYDITLAVEDPDVVSLENATVHATGTEGPLVDTERAANGSELTVTAALLDADHDPAETVDLFEVTLEGQTAGSSNLSVAEVTDLATADLDQYRIETTNMTTISVADPNTGGGGAPPFPMPTAPGDDEPEPAAFELGTVDVEPETTTEAELPITVPVTNVGEAVGNATVAVSLADQTVNETIPELDGGENASATFNLTAPDEPGTYELVVETTDDNQTVAITVAEPEAPSDDPATDAEDGSDEPDEDRDSEPDDDGSDDDQDDGQPSEESAGLLDRMPGFGIEVALVALLIGVGLRRRAPR
ncbi:CARDB domain-containing protein [Saliphagus sp. GCM10025334]